MSRNPLVRRRARYGTAALALGTGLAVLAGLGATANPSMASSDAAAPAVAPAVTPQNGRIYFTDTLLLPPQSDNAPGGQIYSVNPDGTGLRQLTKHGGGRLTGSPAVSPDGSTVAYLTTRRGDGNTSLWLMDANGKHQRPLLATPHTNYYTPAWSPDGSTILLTSCDTDLGEQDCPLVTVHADGTGLATLLSNHRVNTFGTYSPDGTQVQYSSDRDGLRGAIWLVGADGTGSHRITEPSLEGGFGAWAPDGSTIALLNHCCQPHSNIFTINADGSGLKKITHAPFGIEAIGPAYSPDGTQIAYSLSQYGDYESTLQVMDADGKHAHQVLDHNAFQPSWAPAPGTGANGPASTVAPEITTPTSAAPGSLSGTSAAPDGRLLYTDSDRNVVITMNPDGSAPVEVTTPEEGIAVHAAWTADSSQIVVSVLPDDFSRESLYLMNADGSDFRPLVEEPEGVYDFDPQVTPDGQWVLYGRFDGGLDRGGIWAVKLNGTHAHAVTPYAGPHDETGTYFHAISPDGTKLAYEVSDHDGIADQIWVGDLSPRARLSGGAPISAVSDEAFPYSYAVDGSNVLGTNWNAHLGDEVYAFPDSGAAPSLLAGVDYPGELFEPFQSPSGARLGYVQSVGVFNAHFDLVVGDPDGSDPQIVPTSGDHPLHFQWGQAPLLPASSATAAGTAATLAAQPAMTAHQRAAMRAALPKAVRATLGR